MQLAAVVGIVIFLGIVGTFLLFSIRDVMNSDDSSRIDDIPENLEQTVKSGNKIS